MATTRDLAESYARNIRMAICEDAVHEFSFSASQQQAAPKAVQNVYEALHRLAVNGKPAIRRGIHHKLQVAQ